VAQRGLGQVVVAHRSRWRSERLCGSGLLSVNLISRYKTIGVICKAYWGKQAYTESFQVIIIRHTLIVPRGHIMSKPPPETNKWQMAGSPQSLPTPLLQKMTQVINPFALHSDVYITSTHELMLLCNINRYSHALRYATMQRNNNKKRREGYCIPQHQ
jgi:hypothetical protein